MSPKDFILGIIKEYQNARIAHRVDKKIRRGRSRSVSSIVEDLFAYYLVSNDGAIDVVYVDQSIYLEDIKKQICPDTTVVKENTIRAFFDLKTDLGWNRDGLTDLCEKHHKMIKEMKGAMCHLRDGEARELRNYRISESVTYSVVIVSGNNINPNVLKMHLEKVKQFAPDVEVFILTAGRHPNEYGVTPNALLEQLRLNENEFERLLEKVG